MNENDNQQLLKRSEVQRRLNVSASTMFRLIKSKKIPAIRVGNSYRFWEKDLNEFLQNHRIL